VEVVKGFIIGLAMVKWGCADGGSGGGTLRGGDIGKFKYLLVDGDVEEVGDLSWFRNGSSSGDYRGL
nr:hypothetical protein [Tanacetum cinerariifolium]